MQQPKRKLVQPFVSVRNINSTSTSIFSATRWSRSDGSILLFLQLFLNLFCKIFLRPPHYWIFCVWNIFNWESKENWDNRYKGQQKRQISLAVEYPGIPQTIHWESVGRDRRSFATCCFVAWFNSTPIQHKMSTKKAAKSILWHPPNHSLRITGSRHKKFCHRFLRCLVNLHP